MEKFRVYELAKELNTTSKRLMEKLAEVNVVVKNHMSLLEDHELAALYKHIGVVKHEDGKKGEGEKKETHNTPPPKPEVKAEVKSDTKIDPKKDPKHAPRIIRKTEIIIDTKNENKNAGSFQRNYFSRNDYGKNDYSKNTGGYTNGNTQRSGQRQDQFRYNESSSGLRAGYTRDTGRDSYQAPRDVRPPVKGEIKQEKPKEQGIVEKKPVQIEEEKTAKTIPAQQGHEVINEKVESKHTQRDDEQNTKIEKVQVEEGEKQLKEVAAETKPQENPPVQRPQYSGPRGSGDRPQGDRPQGDRPQYNRPYGDRPQGDRPQGDRPQYNRPYGDRPQGDRPQGDRPQYNRPYGDRPQGDRPQGDRPQYNRPYGDRPQGDRPQYNRPYGDRPQGDRPQYNRPYGDRPQGDRPQYNRPYGDRPQGGFDKDKGGYDKDRGGYDNRRPAQGGFRPGGRSMDVPKPELTDIQKEELMSQRNEIRREFSSKDLDKDVKREQKREVPKGQQAAERNKRFRPQKLVLGEKKGVSEVMSDDFILEEFFTDDGLKRTRKVSKPKRTLESKHIPHRAVLTSIKITETITVKDLAEALKKTSTEVIKKLMALGMMVTLNHELDFDTAAIVAEEFGIKTEKEVVVNEEDILFDEDEEEDLSKMEARPPVVVVMGHVDHGKTSLLDAIRETNVMDTEAGGITQHIGAYTVKINHKNITFLDTPGHEAFTAMRARGAQVTDVAIIVVAADDGVMPQTIEAIDHAKAANVSIIIAINKMDKPGANPERVKQELTEHGIVAEEWGGDAIMVPVSAKKREGIDHLLEMVLLAADMLELKANPHKQAKGTIIEAKLDKDRGPVATVLVQRGTLKTGDSIVTGTAVGRIRAMADDKGHKLKKAGPSMPVEILGLPEVPTAGEIFYAIDDEKVAKQLAEKRKQKIREQQLKASAMVSLDDLYAQIKEGKVKDLNLIVKADVQGSVEAVKQSLLKLSNDEVRVKIIHGGVGAITEADVTLAQVASAIIIGFNVRPGANVGDIAKLAGVDIRLYKIIYKALEDIQSAMKGLLEPTFKEVIQGHAEVRQVIKVSGVGTIAGSYVTDGKITRGAEVRVVRDGVVVHEGKLSSLKRFKDDVKEVAERYECGIAIEKFNDLKELDVIEAFIMEEVAR